jgi:hypothetical protein
MDKGLTMYTDFYLKFDSEAQAESVLYTEVPTKWDEDGNVLETEPRANYANIDVLGTLYEGGEWDEDGVVISEPVALEGWHVNVRVVEGEDGEVLEAYEVHPTLPRRVWG